MVPIAWDCLPGPQMLFKAAVEELAVRPAQPDGLQAARRRRPEGVANGDFCGLRARDFALPATLERRNFKTANVKILQAQRLNGIHLRSLNGLRNSKENQHKSNIHKVTFLLRI